MVKQGRRATVKEEFISKSGRDLREKDENQEESSVSSTESIDFLQDPVDEMTSGRRIALWLMKYKWYNPQLKLEAEDKANDAESMGEPLIEQDRPSLEKAWAYFEHVTLPRYIYRPEDGEYPKKMDRAQPGESMLRTKLYSPFMTPLGQLGDFGIGVGMYFSLLFSIMILTFLAGLMSIPNIVYFASYSYSEAQPGLECLLKGSAICTDTSWVPCPTCSSDDFKNADYRFKEDETGTYALKNNCKCPPISIGILSWFTLLFIAISFIIIHHYQRAMQIEFDEDEQTANDYSIHVHNPPHDASDPEEYKQFFSQFGEVSNCTICLNNDELVRALVKRRECYLRIFRKLRKSSATDEEIHQIASEERLRLESKRLKRAFKKCLLYPLGIYDIAKLEETINELEEVIRQLVLKEYPVTNVFVMFETETAQRACLHALSVGKIHSAVNNSKIFSNPNQLFRRKHVLQITEAEEPSTIRWQHLNTTFFGRIKVLTFTILVTISAIVILGLVVKLLHDKSSLYSAYAIAALNLAFPQYCIAITDLEPHKNVGDKQTSLFVKIALFRWVNTVIVIDIITPFVNRVADASIRSEDAALIPSLLAIFKADVLFTVGILLIDPVGILFRHYLGPRAHDQNEMNKYYIGTMWRLAERYTAVSKILFLSFYYTTLYPSAFFLCSFTIFIVYYVDRYCIMRTWKRVPQIGPVIAHFNDKYVVPCYLLIYSIFSSYWWSGFPYDNLCVDDSDTDDGETMYKFCNQDLLWHDFPVSENNQWMTEDQRSITNLFGWTSIGVIICTVFIYMMRIISRILSFFKSDYEPDGRDMLINYSSLEDRAGFVPEVDTKEAPYPFIVGDITNMDDELFDWAPDQHTYDYYNVTKDLNDILSPTEFEEASTKMLFSFVKDWSIDIGNGDQVQNME